MRISDALLARITTEIDRRIENNLAELEAAVLTAHVWRGFQGEPGYDPKSLVAFLADARSQAPQWRAGMLAQISAAIDGIV